ncbi:exp1-like protein [Entomortierella beljakovae]|nr:exp1-like protein [Entomortierella beljakovae]
MLGLSVFRSLSISSVLPTQVVRGMATKAAASSAAASASKKKASSEPAKGTKGTKATKATKDAKAKKEKKSAKAAKPVKKAEKPKPLKIKPVDIPKRPLTSWGLFYVEHLNKVRAAGDPIVPTKETVAASAIWKELSDSQKQPYEIKYQENVAEYKKLLDQRLQELSPSDYKLENSRRQALRAAGKRISSLKDPNAPKRPPGSFLLYAQDQRTSNVFSTLPLTEQSKAIGEAWRKASDAEKAKYIEASQVALKAYQAAKVDYEAKKQ